MSECASGAEAPWWQVEAYPGPDLVQVMAHLHAVLEPASYLEIGGLNDGTFALAACPSLAIASSTATDHNIVGRKPACFLFRMPSDAFFAAHDPKRYLGRGVELALLAGSRHFAQALRDLINVEKHAARNAVILIPGCLPTDAHVARADPEDQSQVHMSATPQRWVGDVWKLVALLRKYRPLLRMHAVRMPPAGLIAITNLDPSSALLERAYFELVAEFAEQTPDQAAVDGLMAGLAPRETVDFLTPARLARAFWL